MLPWDFNLAFGGFQSGNASSVVNFPIDTPVSGINLEDRPILAELLEVPEYLELYHSCLQEIVDGYFNKGTFEQTVNSLDTLISSHIENDPSAFYTFAAYQSGVAELIKLGLLRAESVEGQLNGSVPATTAAQNANPTALIDASSINLSALGSMGGGGGFGGMQNGGGEFSEQNGGGIQSFNRENMQRAMEIIQSAANGELTEEQLSELQSLGITEAQITMFQGMGQGGFGGERPASGQGGAIRPQGGQIPANPSSSAATGYDNRSLLLLGGCTVLLLGGLLFVVFFRRRTRDRK